METLQDTSPEVLDQIVLDETVQRIKHNADLLPEPYRKIFHLDSVYYKTEIRGNYSQEVSLDEETGVGTIHFEQSLWDRYVACLFYPFDHIHCILKKD